MLIIILFNRNKKYIFQNHSYPIHLMNLLYILKKPERAFSIFNDQVRKILSSFFISIFH